MKGKAVETLEWPDKRSSTCPKARWLGEKKELSTVDSQVQCLLLVGLHLTNAFPGLIYIFNLIVGTGALTLPAAFKDAGYLLSSIILILLAFMSFLTATFVIESMAAANALLAWRQVLLGIATDVDVDTKGERFVSRYIVNAIYCIIWKYRDITIIRKYRDILTIFFYV